MYCRRNKELIKELSTSPPDSKELYFRTKYSQSFFNQCMACLWKQHLSYWRNPPYTAVRLLFTTFIALMFGTIFWDIGSIRYAADENNANILLYTLTSMSLIHVQYSELVERKNRICLTRWDQCMLLSSSLVYKMQHQCSRLCRLREQFSTEKEQPECIQLYHMPLDRYYILKFNNAILL